MKTSNIKVKEYEYSIQYILGFDVIIRFNKKHNCLHGFYYSSKLSQELSDLLNKFLDERKDKNPIFAAFNMNSSHNILYHNWLKDNLGFEDYTEEEINPRSGNPIKLLIKTFD